MADLKGQVGPAVRYLVELEGVDGELVRELIDEHGRLGVGGGGGGSSASAA